MKVRDAGAPALSTYLGRLAKLTTLCLRSESFIIAGLYRGLCNEINILCVYGVTMEINSIPSIPISGRCALRNARDLH